MRALVLPLDWEAGRTPRPEICRSAREPPFRPDYIYDLGIGKRVLQPCNRVLVTVFKDTTDGVNREGKWIKILKVRIPE
jgi:hypothetical protein